MTLLEAPAKLDGTDFRVKGRTRHKASEIAAMTACSLMSGGTGHCDFEEFGREREEWLRGFMEPRNGIPGHDTFRRFWQNLAPARLNACFFAWIESLAGDPAGDTIHLDGKCLRRAYGPDGRQPCIVSACSSREKIAVAQVKVDEKSNETTALPELVRMLTLVGAIVTIDAAGCQKKVVVATWKCEQTSYLRWFADKDRWSGLGSVVRIEAETFRQKTGMTTRDERYFMSSLAVDPAKALRVARPHWDVENPLHWVLDMVFDEDHPRPHSGFPAENLAILRHMAYDAMRKSTAAKGGMKRRKKTLTWNGDKLLATMRGV